MGPTGRAKRVTHHSEGGGIRDVLARINAHRKGLDGDIVRELWLQHADDGPEGREELELHLN